MSLPLPELPGEQIGSLAEREALTFADYVPGFLARYAGRTCRGVRPETRETYARELGFQRDCNGDWVALDPARGALAVLGALRLGEIDAARLERYAAGIAARGLSPNTVRMALAPVRALLATALEEGLLASNPAAGLRLGAPPSGAPLPARPKQLTLEQLWELTIAAKPPWQLLIQVLVETGLRFSEAAALTWEEIDLERHRLHVRQRLSHGTLGPPSTENSYRTLDTCAELERALTKLRSSRGYDSAPSAPVFQNRNGRPLDRHHAHQQIKKAATSIGLPWVNLHSLRHTAAALCFQNGFTVTQVQAQLGHHSPDYTLATYAPLLPEEQPPPKYQDPKPPAKPRPPPPPIQPPRQWLERLEQSNRDPR